MAPRARNRWLSKPGLKCLAQGQMSVTGIFRQPSGFHSLMALRDPLHPARRHIPKNGGFFIGVFFDADA